MASTAHAHLSSQRKRRLPRRFLRLRLGAATALSVPRCRAPPATFDQEHMQKKGRIGSSNQYSWRLRAKRVYAWRYVFGVTNTFFWRYQTTG